MREIKFRAWNRAISVMGSALPLDVLTADIAERPEAYHNDWKHLDIMQFTGLHDKNGKEIYEGDIIYRNTWKVPLDESHKAEYAVVSFVRGEFVAIRTTAQADSHGTNVYCYCDGNPQPFEVIGNIYENPDLLK